MRFQIKPLALLVGTVLMVMVTIISPASADPVAYNFTGIFNYTPLWQSDPSTSFPPGYTGPTYETNPFDSALKGMTFQGSFTYDSDASKILVALGQTNSRSGPEPGVLDPTNVDYISVDIGRSVFETFNIDILG